jgi:hypothetical protein
LVPLVVDAVPDSLLPIVTPRLASRGDPVITLAQARIAARVGAVTGP